MYSKYGTSMLKSDAKAVKKVSCSACIPEIAFLKTVL